jgi:hypothetical protein
MRSRLSVSASGERDAARGNHPAIRRHFSFYLVETAEPAGNARTRLEVRARTGSRRELEWPEGRNPHLQRSTSITASHSRRGKPAHLREHLHENHRRDDRLPRKVTIEVKIGRDRVAAPGGALARDELSDPLDEPHRWLVREKLERIDHRVSVYFLPSDA